MSIAVIDKHSASSKTDPHQEHRMNLAATFRISARLGACTKLSPSILALRFQTMAVNV